MNCINPIFCTFIALISYPVTPDAFAESASASKYDLCSERYEIPRQNSLDSAIRNSSSIGLYRISSVTELKGAPFVEHGPLFEYELQIVATLKGKAPDTISRLGFRPLTGNPPPVLFDLFERHESMLSNLSLGTSVVFYRKEDKCVAFIRTHEDYDEYILVFNGLEFVGNFETVLSPALDPIVLRVRKLSR